MKTGTQQSQSAAIDEEVLEVARMAFQHARSGNAAGLAAILDAGLPVNLRNERGDTLLMLASYHGHVDATRVLLAHKADPERTNDRGQTPLAGCAFKGDLTMARLLLDHGTQVDGAGPDGKTALMFAAMFDRVEMMEELISRGARPERGDVEKRTALDYARAMGAHRAAERLAALQQTPA
ncbi:MAG TPA: ankyrin repeat domain-containing protein [Archangium sp.]